MRLDRLTVKSLAASESLARTRAHQRVNSVHLLASLAGQEHDESIAHASSIIDRACDLDH